MRPHLASLLDDFRRFGSDTAVVRHVGNRRRAGSYAEHARLAGRFAALLVARGIGPGDRLILWAENGAEWIAAFYGCMLRGVVAVPLDAYGSAEFVLRVARDVRPALIVGDAVLLAKVRTDWPTIALDDLASLLPADQAGPVASLGHDTPLQILFTSGTTGDPKGIVHTHGNVLSSVAPIEDGARPYMRYERLVHPLRFLHTLPLSHVFGQTMGLWVPAIFAAEVHFDSRLVPARMIETIHRERISVLAGVPRVLASLQGHLEVERPALAERIAAARGISAAKRWWRFRDIHGALGLKFWAFVTGGGALPAPVEQFWNALGFVLVQGYGMTETAALITLNHPFHVARGSIGKPLPGREVKLGADGEVLVRGPMISSATWTGGRLQPREDPWLATGDLAAAEPSGGLRFVGRKSEVIVTAAGVNIHPEDLEAALDQEPGVAGSAVVGVDGPFGPEPCAVLALRGAPDQAAELVARANARLAEFQRLRRWEVWPEPDLPRTSTGKVKRPAVTAWLAGRDRSGAASAAAPGDWLLSLVAGIAGAPAPDEASDLQLDSLGRVQLLAALEERLGVALDGERFAAAQTIQDLRQLIDARAAPMPTASGDRLADPVAAIASATDAPLAAPAPTHATPAGPRYLYPRWPWWLPFRWLRAAFREGIERPLVALLAGPRVVRLDSLSGREPMLIVANHITTYDVPLLLQALPAAMRNRTAVAMSGEMLDDFRHARGNPLGPAAWLLVTALYNAFPLPRLRGFQRSFDHAGAALDHGFHVIVFPEGTRSPDGTLAPFRPGIGLLVKQSSASVLPMALVGLGELKARRRSWFRSGIIEVRVGSAIRFAPTDQEAAITARLFEEVQGLLGV
jgi:long-chain acyl-CoA synthetase